MTTQSLRFSKAAHRTPCRTGSEKKSPRLHCPPLEELSAFVLFSSRWWRPGRLAVSVASLPSGSYAPEVSLERARESLGVPAGTGAAGSSVCPSLSASHPFPGTCGNGATVPRPYFLCPCKGTVTPSRPAPAVSGSPLTFPSLFHLVWQFAQVSAVAQRSRPSCLPKCLS